MKYKLKIRPPGFWGLFKTQLADIIVEVDDISLSMIKKCFIVLEDNLKENQTQLQYKICNVEEYSGKKMGDFTIRCGLKQPNGSIRQATGYILV